MRLWLMVLAGGVVATALPLSALAASDARCTVANSGYCTSVEVVELGLACTNDAIAWSCTLSGVAIVAGSAAAPLPGFLASEASRDVIVCPGPGLCQGFDFSVPAETCTWTSGGCLLEIPFRHTVAGAMYPPTEEYPYSCLFAQAQAFQTAAAGPVAGAALSRSNAGEFGIIHDGCGS